MKTTSRTPLKLTVRCFDPINLRNLLLYLKNCLPAVDLQLQHLSAVIFIKTHQELLSIFYFLMSLGVPQNPTSTYTDLEIEEDAPFSEEEQKPLTKKKRGSKSNFKKKSLKIYSSEKKQLPFLITFSTSHNKTLMPTFLLNNFCFNNQNNFPKNTYFIFYHLLSIYSTINLIIVKNLFLKKIYAHNSSSY